MTRFEQLKNKADLCRQAAAKTKGQMKLIWMEKASSLEIMAANLPLSRASQEIK